MLDTLVIRRYYLPPHTRGLCLVNGQQPAYMIQRQMFGSSIAIVKTREPNPMLGHPPSTHSIYMDASMPHHARLRTETPTPHIRPQCGASLQISGHVKTRRKKNPSRTNGRGLFYVQPSICCLGISGTPNPDEPRQSLSRAALLR
ncbi:hypothetical protein TGAM01_v200751 [Trichoderma gamsii]|uniref:Uncharacterized protein n=1 Tax=Trichoderma gamsii TaxID=398673 RepID=A0A2P5A1E3_9HYPO|nr:hypothetical protein TGAM01_v200751 [Trichoderma gamsii]PON30311.1 hypothetical protein TGAM01_v200751 [Trichoderma gamsii]